MYHRNAFEHSVMLIFCHIIPLLVTMTQNTTHRMYYTFFLLISWRLSIRSGVLYSLALAYNEPFEVLSHYSIHCLFHFLQTFLSLFFFPPLPCTSWRQVLMLPSISSSISLLMEPTLTTKVSRKTKKKKEALTLSVLLCQVLTQVCPAHRCPEYEITL